MEILRWNIFCFVYSIKFTKLPMYSCAYVFLERESDGERKKGKRARRKKKTRKLEWTSFSIYVRSGLHATFSRLEKERECAVLESMLARSCRKEDQWNQNVDQILVWDMEQKNILFPVLSNLKILQLSSLFVESMEFGFTFI